jgi:hypothetical protein
MFDALDSSLAAGDAKALQEAIFDLGWVRNGNAMIPDEVSFKILELLHQPEMTTSPHSAHLLNHFEFHSKFISNRAKAKCREFLRDRGDQFSHFHSRQVVAELRRDDYLD